MWPIQAQQWEKGREDLRMGCVSLGLEEMKPCGEPEGAILVGSYLQPQFLQLQLDSEHRSRKTCSIAQNSEGQEKGLLPDSPHPGGAPEVAAGPARRAHGARMSGDRLEPPGAWSVRRSWPSNPQTREGGSGLRPGSWSQSGNRPG